MVIAFWNVNKKDISDALVDFVKEQQIDILCLAEATDKLVLNFLLKNNKVNLGRRFNQVPSAKDKLVILTSFNISIFTDHGNQYVSSRWAAHQITIPTKIKFNLISVHFHSKVNWSESSLSLECVNLARDIYDIEKNNSCEETILIGDFNMNPFENGIVSANGIHAVQDLSYTVKSSGRIVDGTKYKYFYNPMWNYFGDKTLPFGTHYCRPGGHISQEWNIYDQIMIRPSLKDYFNKNDVKIVSTIGKEKLTKTHNRPDKKKYSDHLPILINLNI